MNSDSIKQTRITEFLERLQKLGNGERAALRRSIGQTLSNADGRALAAFYKALPNSTYKGEEEAYFLMGTCICLWKENTSPARSFIECLIAIKDESESMGRRVVALLDTEWTEQDSYFTGKISRLVRMIRQKGYYCDFFGMLSDLLLWKLPERPVQRRWARDYFGVNNKKEEIKGEN